MAFQVDRLDQSQIVLYQQLHAVWHAYARGDEIKVLKQMLSPIDLLEAENLLLDMLVEVLLNHGWFKVDCFFKG